MILTEQRIYWLLIAVIFVYLLNLLSPILAPFFFSALLAYLGDPIADKLEKRMSRTLSVVVVFVTILLVLILTIAIFIPLVSEQLSNLLHKAPTAIEFIHHKIIPLLEENFQYDAGSGKDTVMNIVRNNLNDIPSLASKVLKWLTGSGEYVFAMLANVFLVPVVTFYLLRDWDILMAKIHALLPRQHEPKIVQIAKESNEMLRNAIGFPAWTI